MSGKSIKYRIAGLCLLLCGWLSAQVSLEMRVESLISPSGSYDVALVTDISEPERKTNPNHSCIHSLKYTLTLPEGFIPDLDAMEIVAQDINLNQAFEWVNSSTFDPSTRLLTLEVSVEVKEGETLPLGNFMPTAEKKTLLRFPLNFTWSADKVGKHVLTVGTAEMTVGQTVDGQFVAVPAGPDAVRLTVSDLEIYGDFLMGGEPLTQNGTEDFSDVKGYDPLIQGINYAFSGSGIYNPDTQAWESIGGREIEIHDLVETDAEGVPVSEEKHIFRIVNKGVDNFELYSVPNANGHSYLKFTVAAKRYPKAERSFLMSYVVDAADDPTIVSTEAGDGVEGQPYSITVDIYDVDIPNKDGFMIFVDRDNYKHYIKIGEKLIPADSIVHYELPTTFTVNALPFDVVANANGSRTPSQPLTVQAVFEKLYPPGKGDFTYSEPVEATFADVDHLPEGVDFELQLASSGKTDDDAVAECKLVAGSDADGDEIRYQATWSLNGSDKTVAGLTLPASETQKGQTWSFKAEAYTQPYGEPIMTGVIKTATYVVDDTLPVITAQTENLHLRNDQSTSATVTVTIADSDIADGTDVYTADNFSVIQSQVKGVISGQTWNPETQSFSFDYRIANPQEGIAAEDGVNVVVEVSHSGSKVSTKPIPVTYVLERPPKWTGDLVLNMNENESRTLDLNELAEDVNGDPLIFGGGILKETGFDSSLEGTMLTVNASYEAVATGEQPKQFRIPVTVKDAYSDAVSGTLVVTVSNVNRAPTALIADIRFDYGKKMNFKDCFEDPDGDTLQFIVSGLNLGQIVDAKGQVIAMGAALEEASMPLTYEMTADQEPVPVCFQIYAQDSEGATSEAVDVKIVMQTSRMASELWGGQEHDGTMTWQALHSGWNLLSVPFDMSAEEVEAFRLWLCPDSLIWGWNFQARRYQALTSLTYNDGFWVYLKEVPRKDFQVSGQLVSNRPKPYGWQLVSLKWALEQSITKVFGFCPQSNAMISLSRTACPWLGVWLYVPKRMAPEGKAVARP